MEHQKVLDDLTILKGFPIIISKTVTLKILEISILVEIKYLSFIKYHLDIRATNWVYFIMYLIIIQ